MKKILAIILCMVTASGAYAYVSQSNWRWRNNDGNQKTATWKAAENTPVTIYSTDSIVRLRIQFNNTLAEDRGLTYSLKYATSPQGPWLYITRLAGDRAFMLARQNSLVNDLSNTTRQLSNTGYLFQQGKILLDSDQHNELLPAETTTEMEWCLKPTENIEKNTTYYFQIAGLDYQVGFPTLKTSSNIEVKPKNISNGGFEQGLKNWKYRVSGSSANASFNVITTQHHFGEQALNVKVNQRGGDNNIALAHAPFNLSNNHTYMVRFWAKAAKNAATMRLVLDGRKTLYYDYKLYTGWREYQFAFKSKDPSLALVFLFTTATDYYIDDVELLQEDHPVVDVPMNYMWQNNRDPKEYGYLTTDGQNSEPLPDGRVAWIFSDSWIGYNDTTSNSIKTNQLLNNIMVVQSALKPNGELTTKYSGTPENPVALILPPLDTGHYNWIWPRDIMVENDSLKVFGPEAWWEYDGSQAAPRYKQTLSVFSLPDLVLRKNDYIPFLDTLGFGAMVKGDDAYNYAYASKGYDPLLSNTYVARFPKGKLWVTQPWEYLSENGWVGDYNQAKPIANVDLYSVIKLGIQHFAAIFLNPLHDKVEVLFAQHPTGPWVGRSIVGQIEGQEAIIAYFAVAHEETLNNGVLTFSYSNNGDIGQMLNDKTVYWPTYLRANILSLSPFTNGVLPVQAISFTAKEVNKIAELEWNTTQDEIVQFEIEKANGANNNWKIISDMKNPDKFSPKTTYRSNDIQLAEGKNYYRIKQIDKHGNISYSTTKLVTYSSKETTVKIFPNPATSAINFEILNLQENTFTTVLTDLKGNVVLQKEFTATGINNFQLEITKKLTPGSYNLLIKSKEFSTSNNVIIH